MEGWVHPRHEGLVQAFSPEKASNNSILWAAEGPLHSKSLWSLDEQKGPNTTPKGPGHHAQPLLITGSKSFGEVANLLLPGVSHSLIRRDKDVP